MTFNCTMGVGCKEAGVCHAKANGKPEMCGDTEPYPLPNSYFAQAITSQHLAWIEASPLFAVCIDDKPTFIWDINECDKDIPSHLTLGKIYKVLDYNAEQYLLVNDRGNVSRFLKGRFREQTGLSVAYCQKERAKEMSIELDCYGMAPDERAEFEKQFPIGNHSRLINDHYADPSFDRAACIWAACAKLYRLRILELESVARENAKRLQLVNALHNEAYAINTAYIKQLEAENDVRLRAVAELARLQTL